MEALASDGGLLPEQVWDAPDIPERELFNGRPSGSAMPLVWAHAEYAASSLRSLRRRARSSTCRRRPWQRYRRASDVRRGACRGASTRSAARCRRRQGPAHRGAGCRRSFTGAPTAGRPCTTRRPRTRALGVHSPICRRRRSASGATVSFTFYWPGVDRWEGTDFSVAVVGAGS